MTSTPTIRDLFAELAWRGGRIALRGDGRVILRGRVPAELIARLREHRALVEPVARLQAVLSQDDVDRLLALVDDRLNIAAVITLPPGLATATDLVRLVDDLAREYGRPACSAALERLHDRACAADVDGLIAIEAGARTMAGRTALEERHASMMEKLE